MKPRWWRKGVRWSRPDLMPKRPHEMPSVRNRAGLDELDRTVTLAWVRNEARVYIWHDDKWRIL